MYSKHRPFVILAFALAVCLTAGAAVYAQSPSKRRILDIELQDFGNRYRMTIFLDSISKALIKEPGLNEPLIIELGRADFDPTMRPRPESNDMFRRIVLEGSDSGLVTIKCELATSQVDVSQFSLDAEGMIVVDVKLRPGVKIEDDKTRPAVTPALPGQGPTMNPALPSVSGTEPEYAPVEGQGEFDVPPSSDGRRPDPDSIEIADYFPYHLVQLNFNGAQEMVEAYQQKRYLDAYKAGLRGLSIPQTRESMESLLFLLAESYYQLNRGRFTDTELEPLPDWDGALNHYRQARRYGYNSLIRPFADYRISQIHGIQGDYEKQHGVLHELVVKGDYKDYPLILWDFAESARFMHNILPDGQVYLDRAKSGFIRFVGEFPKHRLHDEAKLHLGEVYYHYGDYLNCYKNIYEAMAGRPAGPGSDIHAHWSLAAHWLGKTDLVNPNSRADRNFLRYIEGSLDSDVRMQYADLLASAGERRKAMLEYNRIATGGVLNPSDDQIFKARLALTRYALEDLRQGGLNPTIPFDDYMEPFTALEDLYENSFDLQQRTQLLLEQARHLIAMNEEIRAIRLILSLLETKDLPEEQALELRRSIWDIMPRVMKAFYQGGDQLLALRIYKAFGQYLSDHPKRNEILLNVARIMTEAGMRSQALEALGRMDPYASLTPDLQAAVTMLRRELRLDPDDTERYKREAPSVLAYEYDDQTRARIINRLAKIYSDEGEGAYAAQLYLRGAGLEGLTPAKRMDFYMQAAREYEKALNYSKAIEVYYQGLYDLEEAGVPPAEGRVLYEPAVLGIAVNFEAMTDYNRAAKAYETYLSQYPDSEKSSMAQYGLARAYQRIGNEDKAIEMYKLVSDNAPADSLWKSAAEQSLRQLQWEKEHPYLLRKDTP